MSKARMRLMTSRWCWIREPSSSMQRGKMVLVLLSASLAHAASARPALVKSTAQERKIYGVFQLAPHKVQYANPGLACTPDQAKSGCWAPQADRRDEKTWSSRAGSKDSQRPRGWTQDEPGGDLHAGSMAKEQQLVESLLIKQIAD